MTSPKCRQPPPRVSGPLSAHGPAQARHRPGTGPAQARHRPGKRDARGLHGRCRNPAAPSRHLRGTLAAPWRHLGGTLAEPSRHHRGTAAPARRVSGPHSRQTGGTLKKLEKRGKDFKRMDSAQSLAVLWWLGRGGAFPAAPAKRPEGWGALVIFGGFFGSVPRYSPVFQGVSPETA